MICPKCNSENVQLQTIQENVGTTTISKTKSKYKEKGHGLMWWIFIGSWWWMVDLFLWIFAFFPRLILRLFAAPFKKKKYKGQSTTVSQTVNNIVYKTVCTCQNCGNTWVINANVNSQTKETLQNISAAGKKAISGIANGASAVASSLSEKIQNSQFNENNESVPVSIDEDDSDED